MDVTSDQMDGIRPEKDRVPRERCLSLHFVLNLFAVFVNKTDEGTHTAILSVERENTGITFNKMEPCVKEVR